MTDTLACGHEPSAHSSITTGYATRSDGTRICYDCADWEQREALKTADRYSAYLSPAKMDSVGSPTGYVLSTWTGGELAKVTRLTSAKVNAFGGKIERYYFRAIDRWGQHWYGTSPGPQMYARMRKAR